MKTLLVTTLATGSLFFASAAAQAAEHYTLDASHTNIVWKADHLGFSAPSGKFTKVEGDLTLDEKHPEKSSVNVTIYPMSITTGNEKFDGHLRSADFFNVDAFAKAMFRSTSIKKTGDNTADIRGNLTLLGVTKPVTLKARLNKIAPNPYSQAMTAGFSAKAVIKRSEFGVNYGLPGIGDDVVIDIETEFVQK